jgi:hypothetical protein
MFGKEIRERKEGFVREDGWGGDFLNGDGSGIISLVLSGNGRIPEVRLEPTSLRNA